MSAPSSGRYCFPTILFLAKLKGRALPFRSYSRSRAYRIRAEIIFSPGSMAGRRLDCAVAALVGFPHLRSKIVQLNGYAASRKPRSVRQLWGDRRDSTAWLALWSVLIFGSASLLLALLQTVFQIRQYIDARHGGGN